jgi:hypothetical protein
MPIFAEQASIPKVRASSGTMGTIYDPIFLSEQFANRWTMAMVVATSRSPDPLIKLGHRVLGRRAKDGHGTLRAGR